MRLASVWLTPTMLRLANQKRAAFRAQRPVFTPRWLVHYRVQLWLLRKQLTLECRDRPIRIAHYREQSNKQKYERGNLDFMWEKVWTDLRNVRKSWMKSVPQRFKNHIFWLCKRGLIAKTLYVEIEDNSSFTSKQRKSLSVGFKSENPSLCIILQTNKPKSFIPKFFFQGKMWRDFPLIKT